MFYEINRNLCETYRGLDPLKLLDYPAEDVIDLINNTLSYNQRHIKDGKESKTVRKQAGDNWF